MTVKLTITKSDRTRYAEVIKNRINEKIAVRKNFLLKDKTGKDKFLKERNIFDEYMELKKLEERCEELKEVIKDAVGACGSVEYIIEQKIKNEIDADQIILDYKKKLRRWDERIVLARTFEDLDNILEETNKLFEE